ncbi:Histidine phosphatase superfamily (branch 1) [Psychroflexus salarius]|uniref:Histidine phosphatase superfamily (Branch 1) n=1 Tax=Psychroflexus salarius TaxID=1155689 RepID=A0A1M4SPZ1_9FLAO|nr:histidine phosphatase family protein [Psychroflexus salarius]SHE34261.1 Histidine phosphatase superfamily (branch 1) [Psychroflexus salarius]
MKRFLYLLPLLIITACQNSKPTSHENTFWYDLPSENAKKTTYYFIRHAEKNRNNPEEKDPFLTEKGLKRANHWAKYFEEKNIDQIFSSNYTRCIQTAIPSASLNQLKINDYDVKKDTLFTDNFWKKTYGKTNLIIGHSNTTPQFVNQILNNKKYEMINDSINYKLFKVEISKELKIKDTVLDVKLAFELD